MDAYLGTWVLDKSKTTDDPKVSAQIMHLPADKAEMLGKITPEITVAKEGDGYVVKLQVLELELKEGPFKLGEPFDHEDVMNDRTVTNLITVEGGKVFTKSSVKGSDIKWEATRHLEGDHVVNVLTNGTLTTTQYLKRK